jgi:hypothetical protein
MQYQNLMFMTAGYLVEVITGLTWEQFVQKEIFSPLGMSRSNVSVEDLKNLEDVSLPYRKDKNLIKEIEFANIDTIGPAGSINSSIVDMTQWLKLQMGDGKFGENQIVSKTNLDEMHKPNMVISNAFFGPLEKYPEFANGSYGLGWFINTYHGQKLVHHGGNIDGFSAMVAFMPDEKCGVVVLTNLNGTPVRDIAMLNLFDRFLGKKQLPWSQRMKKEYKELEDAVKKGKKQGQTKRVHNTRPSHQPEAYIGEFEHAGYGTVTISKDTDGLKSNYNGMDMKLKHYHYDVFEMTNEEIEMTLKVNFFSDVHGNITSFSTPLEPSVKDIIFTRKADSKVSDQNFLEQFVGDYELMGQNMIVSLHGSNLSIKLPGQPELELEPYQGTSFKVKNVPAILIEFKIENGHVTAVDVNQAGMLFTGKKK